MRRQLFVITILCAASAARAELITEEWKILPNGVAPAAISPDDAWSILPVEKIVLPTLPAIDLNPDASTDWTILATATEADRARDGQSVSPRSKPSAPTVDCSCETCQCSPRCKCVVARPASKTASQRQLEYWEATQRALKNGATIYHSDGGEGTKLPAGSYRLVGRDGEVYFMVERMIVPRLDANDDAIKPSGFAPKPSGLAGKPSGLSYGVSDCPSCARGRRR